MNVHGKTAGLKALQVKRLERLALRRVRTDVVVPLDLATAMAALSREIGRQIGLLIGREGTVYSVLIGDEREILIPDIAHLRFGKTALRGVRWVHTHLKGEPLTRDDLTDLALLRFDLVAALTVLADGALGPIHAAHLLPPNPDGKIYALLPPISAHQFHLPFGAFLRALEAEFDAQPIARTVADRNERAILISASRRPRLDQEASLNELADLARAARLSPIDRVIQRPSAPHPKYLIGQGKLKEVIMTALQHRADLLIFDQQLTPLQVREIGAMTEMKTLDRTQLILDIFAQRAKTREAKVQVELAQLKYRLPRLSERSTALSRLTGGIGGRGPGETRLEIDLRRARQRITRLEQEHEALSRARARRRTQRVDRRVPILSIVGYTNAGKSTLLNALTASDISTGDALFETLETTTRRLRFPREREVILTDTVGFIRALPTDLLGAFRSTLDELRDAHLLIHLADGSNPCVAEQIEAVETLLSDLELNEIPRLLVFNKNDRCAPETREALCARYNAISISAMCPETFGPLLAVIESRVWGMATPS